MFKIQLVSQLAVAELEKKIVGVDLGWKKPTEREEID